MNSVVTAIVAALEAKLAKADSPTTQKTFQSLKNTLAQKTGADSPLMLAIAGLEKKPRSANWRQTLAEEVAEANLNQDEAATALAEALINSLQPPPATPPPLQHPPRVEKFIGRAAELSRLVEGASPEQVMSLYGPPGSGKTALIAEVVSRLAPKNKPPAQFPDGIIYYSFYNQPRVEIALEYIVRTFGETSRPTAYDAAREVLQRRQALLIFDDADYADDLPGLLEVRGRCGMLVVSTQQHPAIPERCALGPLSPEEAVEILQQWGGWYAKEQEPAQKVCEFLGNLPLALRLAGQSMMARGESAAQFLTWLEEQPLSNPPHTEAHQQILSLLQKHSLAHTDATAQHILAVCGLLAFAPFDSETISIALTEKPPGGVMATLRGIFKQTEREKPTTVMPALRVLTKFGLLEKAGNRYQVSHPEIHRYARQHLNAPPTAIRQLATYYVTLAWKNGLSPEDDARLNANHAHIMTVLAECLKWKDWEAAHGLAVAIEDYLDQHEYWAERVRANEIGLIASWQLGRPSEGVWLGNLGDTYRLMGNPRWAIEHFEKALTTAQQTSNLHSQANALGNLGLAYRDKGQPEQARAYLQQALTIFEKLGAPSAAMVREWLKEMEG